MRILVTGGAGFIGSHLVETLLVQGHHVTVLDDLSTGRPRNLDSVRDSENFDFVEGSIIDEAAVDRAMTDVDVVYHLAAAVGVELIVRRPLDSLRTNIRGSEVVLDCAHRRRARVLITSSSEIYGKNTSDRLREDDDRILGSPLKSRWSYSEAKAIDEILAHLYWRETGLQTIIVRLFNTVGPRQTGRYGMVLPRFVEQALRGDPLTVYGTGMQTRCFSYVGDIVRGMTALCDHPEAVGQVFNLGGVEEVTMRNLAERVIAATGSTSTIDYVPYDVAYEEGFEDMQRRVPDTTRAFRLVGFRPTVGLEGIIRSVIAEQSAS